MDESSESGQHVVGEAAGVTYMASPLVTADDIAEWIRTETAEKVVVLPELSADAGLPKLAQTIEDHGVLHALVVGKDTLDLAKALLSVGFDHFTELGASTPEQIVQTLYHLTEPGDVAMVYTAALGEHNAVVAALTSAVAAVREHVDAA